MGHITLWHGARRWDGKPIVRPALPGRYECGPGIYLTTQYATARKYAAGGDYAMRAVLRADVRWLQHARLALDTLVDFVIEAPRLRARRQVLIDLRNAAANHPNELVPVEYLVNCCVNNDALSGEAGPQLAAWLVAHGIDASLYSNDLTEDWVVVFNPSVIVSVKPVPASQVDLAERTHPKVCEQLADAISENPECLEGEKFRL